MTRLNDPSHVLHEGPEAMQHALARLTSAAASHQRFHHALPEVIDRIEQRGLWPVLGNLRYLQERIDKALDQDTRLILSRRLIDFQRNPYAVAAPAADQLWADRAALQGMSREQIVERLLARGAHQWLEKIPSGESYATHIAERAIGLAERVQARLARRMQTIGRVVLNRLSPELKLAGKAAGMMSGKLSVIGLASFMYTLVTVTRRQMLNLARGSEERSR
jgi:hypothetical protein